MGETETGDVFNKCLNPAGLVPFAVQQVDAIGNQARGGLNSLPCCHTALDRTYTHDQHAQNANFQQLLVDLANHRLLTGLRMKIEPRSTLRHGGCELNRLLCAFVTSVVVNMNGAVDLC